MKRQEAECPIPPSSVQEALDLDHSKQSSEHKTQVLFTSFCPPRQNNQTNKQKKEHHTKKRPNISLPRLQIQAHGKTGNSQQTLMTLAQGLSTVKLKHLHCHWKGWGGDRNSLLQWGMSACYINTKKNRTLQITHDVALAIFATCV